jgi:hypothetical protein
MWQSGLYRGFVLIIVLVGITAQPILLLVLPVIAIYGFATAEERWLPSALIPAIRQEYNRTLRKATERARHKSERERGARVFDEETNKPEKDGDEGLGTVIQNITIQDSVVMGDVFQDTEGNKSNSQFETDFDSEE